MFFLVENSTTLFLNLPLLVPMVMLSLLKGYILLLQVGAQEVKMSARYLSKFFLSEVPDTKLAYHIIIWSLI